MKSSCAGEIDLIDANPDIVPARIQGDPREGAGDFRVVLKEPHPLARQFVEIRGWGPSQLSAAVDTQFGVADVVHKDIDDVRLFAKPLLQLSQLGLNLLVIGAPLLAERLLEHVVFGIVLLGSRSAVRDHRQAKEHD